MAQHVSVARPLPNLRIRGGIHVDRHAVGSWSSLLAVVVSRGYLTFVVTLALGAIVPTTLGWSAYVVRSGSMAPAIRPGDVVDASPISPTTPIPVGRVMTFVDPSTPHRVLVHRVVAERDDGTYTTAGDANPADDRAAVPRAAFTGRGRLRIPWVGLPALWLYRGDTARLTIWGVLTALALAIAVPRPRRATRGPAAHGRGRAPAAAASGLIALFVTCGLVAGTAAASFSADTRNAGNSWTLSSRILLAYTQQILADTPYLYYQLDEASGTSVADTSGNARTGTYTTPITYHQTGAMVRVPDYAVTLAGGGARVVSGGTAVNNPTTFSLELWFKTTTTHGGKLVGFESTQASTSSKFDRHAFMLNNGRISFGNWSGGSQRVITTAASYNNGAWHHLVVTAAPISGSSFQNSNIYVDGVNVVDRFHHPGVVLHRLVAVRLRQPGQWIEHAVERRLRRNHRQRGRVQHRPQRDPRRQPLRVEVAGTGARAVCETAFEVTTFGVVRRRVRAPRGTPTAASSRRSSRRSRSARVAGSKW